MDRNEKACVADTQNRYQSIPLQKKNHITKEECQEGTKQQKNNNSSSKSLLINNYSKCKWIRGT